MPTARWFAHGPLPRSSGARPEQRVAEARDVASGSPSARGLRPRAQFRSARRTRARIASEGPSARCPSGTPRSIRSLRPRRPGARCTTPRRRPARRRGPRGFGTAGCGAPQQPSGGRPRARSPRRRRAGSAQSRVPRANLKSASTVPGVLAPKTCLHEPAFAFLTLKTKAPATGCESAEITRHVTV